MSDSKKYARISSPHIYTTKNGSRYVRPFDILRSDAGRAIIERYTDAKSAKVQESVSQPSASEKTDPRTKS